MSLGGAQIPKRSAIDCRIRWLQHDHPQLTRHKPWTTPETDKLLELVKKYDKSNWAVIAHELGTGRTAADCVRRYRDTTFEQHEFSHADDERLKELVAEHAMDWQKSQSPPSAEVGDSAVADFVECGSQLRG